MQRTKYDIGTKFTTRGKRQDVCTVIDILSTFNSAGELVRIRYVAEHEFCGQQVTDYDVAGTTIAKGLIQ